jgi:hypothetical protein
MLFDTLLQLAVDFGTTYSAIGYAHINNGTDVSSYARSQEDFEHSADSSSWYSLPR